MSAVGFEIIILSTRRPAVATRLELHAYSFSETAQKTYTVTLVGLFGERPVGTRVVLTVTFARTQSAAAVLVFHRH